MTRYTPTVPRAREAAEARRADFCRRLRRAASEARRRGAHVDVVGARLVDELFVPGATAEQRAHLLALERATRSAPAGAW